MFEPIKGGTVEHIQGLDCWIPSSPQKEEVANYYLPKKQQKWSRTPLPTFRASDINWFSGDEYEPDVEIEWDTARREEQIKQTGCDPWDLDRTGTPKPVSGIVADPNYVDENLEAFRGQEFDRIINGYWFYCNGKKIYITGFHYFYLNWWKLNTGYPDFRDTDRQIFYFWQYCYEDDNSYGMAEVTKRGVGKSYRVGSVAYLMCITWKNVHVGMQSKTDDDAEELFRSKIVEPMKDLPDFLVPLNSHGTDPKKELRFFAPARRGKMAAMARIEKKKELRSFMTYKNSGEKAYDSTTLKFIIHDELGKLDPKLGDAQKRLGVVRNCVYRDSKMVGKIWGTTTVEEMEKGGDAVKRIWYSSDVTKRSEIGRTKSGLYRFFTSALDCSHYDEFGFPNRERARIEHDAERKMKEGDSLEYTGYVQRNPYTIEEAFMSGGDTCIYNAMILQRRQIFLQDPANKATRRGDFVWENGVPDSKAIFVPNEENGLWEVSWLFPDAKNANKVKCKVDYNGFKTYEAGNKGKFGIAHDPYSHAKTVDKRRSNAATAVFRNFDYWEPETSDTFVADYVGRREDPKQSDEDLLIACHYFGCPALVENNKTHTIEHFHARGYSDFVLQRPESTFTKKGNSQQTDGIPSVEPVIELYINLMKTHIIRHGHKLKHLRIVKDLLDFDPSNRTKFDMGVASQLSLIAATAPVDEEPVEVDTGELFDTWDNSGEFGQNY